MARKRMIDPNFWLDEKLGQCTRDERLLFMGLISSADDEGYGRANPKLLRSSLFPYDDLRVSDIDKWLSRLGGLRLIALYQVDGQTYYYLPNFLKHQTINRPSPSCFPKQKHGKPVKNEQFSERSLNTHGALTECSLNTHGALSANRREENRREKNRREREENTTPFIPQQPIDKTTYAEFVTMTPQEYAALCARVGEAGAKRCIEILDNYKGANGKRYKSDYRAILSWVIQRYREEPAPENEPKEPKVYPYPTPEEDTPAVIPDGATLADILPPAEEGEP